MLKKENSMVYISISCRCLQHTTRAARTRNRGIRVFAMKDDYEVDEKKQAAADVLFSYSKFAMACIGNQTRPSDMRLHLMKEISGLPTSLKRREASRAAISPDPVGESSSSGTARLDKVDSFRAL